jgi:hypothetical protein
MSDQGAGFVTVAVAEPLFLALMVFGTEHCGDLQLDELLQSVACQLGYQLPGSAAIE